MDNYSYNSSYPESGDSSPRSREIEFDNPLPWEDSQPPSNYKVKFLCSYGGKIHPRPHDNQLSYVGGETKILSVDRSIRFAQFLSKLISMCDGDSISFKYQLPGEDLDALISVTNDDDLEHMMHEYDRLYKISPKPARLRIFIFPSLSQNPSLSSSARSFGSEEAKSEKEKFVEALNSAPILTPSPQPVSPAAALNSPQIQAGNAEFLFGSEKANAMAAMVPLPHVQHPAMVGRVQEMEDPVVPGLDDRMIGLDPIQKHIQDLQRLRLEEQQQGTNYRRKSDDSLSGGFEGDYYRVPEKISQIPNSGAGPYYTEKQMQIPVGAYPVSTNEQPVYMIPAQSSAYHAPMVRQVTGAPAQGYYTIQRMPQDYYREQQQMYSMMPPSAVQSMVAAPPSMPLQQATGYAESYGMVRPTGGVGMAAESGYAQMAYDGGMGRQVIYTAQGAVMGAPSPVQAAAVAQYPTMASAALSPDMRQGGALNTEAGGKVIAKATQPSL